MMKTAKRTFLLFFLGLFLGVLRGHSALAFEWSPIKPLDQYRSHRQAYHDAIRKTATMVSDSAAQQFAQKHGLQILNLTWEDTGRYKNSAVGPNISDMTIQVVVKEEKGKKVQTTLMPIIRFPNFSDKTGDLDPRDFTLLVGNQKDKNLRRVSLYEFLQNPSRYLSNPRSWRNRKKSLLAERDSKVLVSAQAAFLPVPRKGKATFNPVLFNYQSVSGDPAVLTILATPKGTSVTVIDNKRDGVQGGYAWGQRLFHNQDGQRTSLTGERFSDLDLGPKPNPKSHDPKTLLPQKHQGLSMVLLIQVPLKQKHPMRSHAPAPAFSNGDYSESVGMVKKKRAKVDIEAAAIGYGDFEGPFTEIDHLSIERDPRYPIRVTVQFYKATSNGIIDQNHMAAIAKEINQVYERSEYVGSLVVAGQTGRVTEYEGSKVQPAHWWQAFWQRHYQNTGESPWQAQQILINLLGRHYQKKPVCDLYLRDLLRPKEDMG